MKTPPHLTGYPWSNGTVEVMGRELKRITSAILIGFCLPHTMWKSTLQLVKDAFNNMPPKWLSGNFILTLFTGKPQNTPVASIVNMEEKVTNIRNPEESRLEAILRQQELHAVLKDMHGEAAQSTGLRRSQATAGYKKKTEVRPVNLTPEI